MEEASIPQGTSPWKGWRSPGAGVGGQEGVAGGRVEDEDDEAEDGKAKNGKAKNGKAEDGEAKKGKTLNPASSGKSKVGRQEKMKNVKEKQRTRLLSSEIARLYAIVRMCTHVKKETKKAA